MHIPSLENHLLKIRFRWLKQQTAKGARKFLGAFREAVENEEEKKKKIGWSCFKENFEMYTMHKLNGYISCCF